MRKQLLTIALLVFTAYCVSAQRVSIENIEKPRRTEFGAIKEGTDVRILFFLAQ